MDINLFRLLTTLAEPPGDLIYHLVISLAFILTVGFAIKSLGQAQSANQTRRILVGCGILLGLQVLVFGLRFLDMTTSEANIYTLVERLVAVLTIPWLIWVFSDHDKPNLHTIINVILTVGLTAFAGVSILLLPTLAQLQTVNLLMFNFLWQFIALTLIVIGLVLVVLIPVNERFVMVFILLLLAVGHITQIILLEDLQWSMGAVRFAHILSLPWVLVLIQHFSKGQALESFLVTEPEAGRHELPVDTRPALINLLLKINLTHNLDEKFRAIVQALGLSVVADICYLVKIPESGEKLHIIAGYDLIRETFQNPDTLAGEDLPRIMDAWQANQVLELSQDQEKSRDSITLAMLLKYHAVGNLFAYPLGLPNNPLAGGVIFLSPYTGKTFGNKTRQLMGDIKDTLTMVLYSPNVEEQARLGIKQVQQKMNTLIEEQKQLRKILADKETQIQEKDTAIKTSQAKYQIEKMELVTAMERMKVQILDLSSKLTAQQEISHQLEQIKTEMRHIRNERDQLTLALSRAKATIRDLQTQTGQTGPIRLSLDSQIISLDSIAANTRLRVASHLQENDIELEINNPDGRQMIKTDPELLQTALLELISNAIKASEPGGTIRLDQKLSLEMGMLTIQVTDFGDGLSQTEQTDLFSAQHDTIPGIGDVHSIRNAIRAIRVLNGKIWLKSKKASYTTFRFQIPVRIID